MENKKTNENYVDDTTSSVRPYRQFEQDFTSPGAFIEETDYEPTTVIRLVHNLYPGKFNGRKWENQIDSDDDSYCIQLVYRNRNQIEVNFDADYGSRGMKTSFAFVESAAKLFYLKNEVFEQSTTLSIWVDEKTKIDWFLNEISLPSSKKQMTWVIYKRLIAQQLQRAKQDSFRNGDLRYGHSWSKTMTVKEAKKLFTYLKIKVQFPS
jgi:hypothetical protein